MKLVTTQFREIDGDPVIWCPHMVIWFPIFRLYIQLKLGVDLAKLIIQSTGDAEASAGTHDGPSTDYRTWVFVYVYILTIVAAAREGGARATWYRNWSGNTHIHSVLDCPCDSAADYQTRAVDRGGNGLGWDGMQGTDPHKAPSARRDYATGMIWMAQQIQEMEMANMPTADEIAGAMLNFPMTANGKTSSFAQHLVESFVSTAAQSAAAAAEARRDGVEARQLDGVDDQLDELMHLLRATSLDEAGRAKLDEVLDLLRELTTRLNKEGATA